MQRHDIPLGSRADPWRKPTSGPVSNLLELIIKQPYQRTPDERREQNDLHRHVTSPIRIDGPGGAKRIRNRGQPNEERGSHSCQRLSSATARSEVGWTSLFG